MIKYPFVNPSGKELLANALKILYIHSGYQPREIIWVPTGSHHITAISSLANTNTAAKHNYEHCVQVTAALLKKYATSFS